MSAEDASRHDMVKFTKSGDMYKRPVMKVKRGGPVNGGRVGPLTGRLAEMVRPKPVKVWEWEFRPVRDLDAYLRSLKNSGTSEEELEGIRARHERHMPPPPQPKYVYKPETTGVDPVKVTLKIKGGKVRVGVKVPYDHVLDYCRAGKPVPFEVMLRAMKMNGASDEYLLGCIAEHDKMEARREKDGEAFMKVFEKYTGKGKPKVLKAVKKLPPTF